jgi:hypothetical protein
MSMEDILKSIQGGVDSRSAGNRQAVDSLSDLLKGILGGASSGRASPQGGAGGLPDILGGILGGGTQDGFGLDDILGAIMGTGGLAVGANSFLAPIAQALADRLGLSPALAQAVVAFAVSKLLPALLGGAGAVVPGRQASVAPTRPSAAGAEGLDLDHLLERMGSGQQLEPSFLQSTGLVSELQQQTGLDSDTAVQSLQQVFGLFGAQLAGPEPQPKPQGLDHLLDTWEVDES